MKQEFLNFINKLMKANPKLTEELMTEEIKAYLDILRDSNNEKPELTENGQTILKYLQQNIETTFWKSKDIADQLGIASRSVSGTMRKLVNDGFCEKMGANPIVYILSDKGKNYKFND